MVGTGGLERRLISGLAASTRTGSMIGVGMGMGVLVEMGLFGAGGLTRRSAPEGDICSRRNGIVGIGFGCFGVTGVFTFFSLCSKSAGAGGFDLRTISYG